MEGIVSDRVFKGVDGKSEYYIAQPSADDIREAEWAYSKTYTKCLVEGITTSHEMMDILRVRGIIGPEFDQRANELAQILNDKISELNSAESIDDKRVLAIEVAKARDELFQWNQRLNGPMSNTCEQISEDAKVECLTSSTVRDKSGKRVWETHRDFLDEKDSEFAAQARLEVMLYLQGMESDFLDKTPEAMAMKEVEKDVMEKAQALLSTVKDDEVDKESTEKPVKKKTSKKKGTTNKKK